MLSAFLDWGNAKCAKLMDCGYAASIIACEESSNTGALLELSSKQVLARITAWTSGDVYLEVINIASEQTTYSKHGCLSAAFDFDNEFREFFAAVGFVS